MNIEGTFYCVILYFPFLFPGVQIRSSLNVSTTEFAELYSWYSWPNVVLPVIGGLMIDSVFGLRLGTVIFSALCCAGQLLLGLGASKVKHQFSAFVKSSLVVILSSLS